MFAPLFSDFRMMMIILEKKVRKCLRNDFPHEISPLIQIVKKEGLEIAC